MEAKNKKPTNAQLNRRIEKAIIHVDRTKDTKEVFFDDRNIRVTVNEDMAVLQNGIYTTIFQRYFFGGESSQYECLKMLVECAETYKDDILVTNKKGEQFRSFEALGKVMEEKNDPNNVWFTILRWFIYNYEANIALAPRLVFDNGVLYSLYEKFAHSVSSLDIFSKEHKEGLSNKEYFKAIAEKLIEVANDMNEAPMFVPKSDEQVMKEELDALQKDMEEKVLEEQANEEQPK